MSACIWYPARQSIELDFMNTCLANDLALKTLNKYMILICTRIPFISEESTEPTFQEYMYMGLSNSKKNGILIIPIF